MPYVILDRKEWEPWPEDSRIYQWEEDAAKALKEIKKDPERHDAERLYVNEIRIVYV
jgi:hypothetical protein